MSPEVGGYKDYTHKLDKGNLCLNR